MQSGEEQTRSLVAAGQESSAPGRRVVIFLICAAAAGALVVGLFQRGNLPREQVWMSGSPMLASAPPGDRFRKAMVLAVPFAANIGGLGTPIGSPPNAVAVGFIRKLGYNVTFVQWMLLAVPLALCLLVATWGLLWVLFRPGRSDLKLHAPAQRITARTLFVAGVFSITVVLWLSEAWHGLPAAVVALLPAIAFTASGLLSARDVNSLEWNILILIAGGIALGAGMQLTGLDQSLAGVLARGLHGMGMVTLLTFVLATLVLSTFISNTAVANLMLPIAVSFALQQGAQTMVIQVAVSVALAASLAMALPISSPPNAIAYSRGHISTRDMALTGSLIGIAGAAAIVLGSGRAVRLAMGL